MKNEDFPILGKKSDFQQKLEQKEAEGWSVLGKEHLTRVKFSQEAMFEQIPLQSEAQILERYKTDLKKQAPDTEFELELILDENTPDFIKLKELLTPDEYQEALVNIAQEKKSFIVLARKK